MHIPYRAYDMDKIASISERTSQQAKQASKKKLEKKEGESLSERKWQNFFFRNDCRGVVWMRQKHKHHLKHMLRCATLTTRKFIGFRSQIKIWVTTIQKHRKKTSGFIALRHDTSSLSFTTVSSVIPFTTTTTTKMLNAQCCGRQQYIFILLIKFPWWIKHSKMWPNQLLKLLHHLLNV